MVNEYGYCCKELGSQKHFQGPQRGVSVDDRTGSAAVSGWGQRIYGLDLVALGPGSHRQYPGASGTLVLEG
jgi:hypothetical protein